MAAAIRLAASSPGRRSAPAPSSRTVAPPAAEHAGRLADHRVRDHGRSPRRQRRCGLGAAGPRGIGRQDQGGHASGRPQGRGHGLGGVGRDIGGAGRMPDPVRHRPGQRADVGFQRRIEALVVRGVITNHVDQRGSGPAGVVQVREAVRQARPQVQEGGRGAARHPAVAVRRTGGHALEQAEHRAEPGDRVQAGHHVHLGGAGVAEADVHPAAGQGADQRLGTVHSFLPGTRRVYPAHAPMSRQAKSPRVTGMWLIGIPSTQAAYREAILPVGHEHITDIARVFWR